MRRTINNVRWWLWHHRLVLGLGSIAILLSIWGQLDGFKGWGWPGFKNFGESLVASFVGIAVGAIVVLLLVEREQRRKEEKEDAEVRRRAAAVRKPAARFVYTVAKALFQVPRDNNMGAMGGRWAVEQYYQQIADALGVVDVDARRVHGPDRGRDNPAFQTPISRGRQRHQFPREQMDHIIEVLDRTIALFPQGLVHLDLLNGFEQLSNYFVRERSQWDAYDNKLRELREVRRPVSPAGIFLM